MGSVSPPTPSLRDNRLLALLDARTLAAIAPHFRPLTLELRTMLYVEGKAMRYAYFPVEGVMSMIAAVAGARAQIEVGTVGNEGMVGLPLFLGGKHALGDCFAQVSGVAWRIGGADFVAATQAHPAFARVLHRYTQALMVQISQSTACNRVHSVVERCARWLLMTHDRVQGDTFDLTQEFLGQMLGERRPMVSRTASTLQDRGLIAYSRGRITVLDRPRLEETACGCYRVIRDEYDAMLGGD